MSGGADYARAWPARCADVLEFGGVGATPPSPDSRLLLRVGTTARHRALRPAAGSRPGGCTPIAGPIVLDQALEAEDCVETTTSLWRVSLRFSLPVTRIRVSMTGTFHPDNILAVFSEAGATYQAVRCGVGGRRCWTAASLTRACHPPQRARHLERDGALHFDCYFGGEDVRWLEVGEIGTVERGQTRGSLSLVAHHGAASLSDATGRFASHSLPFHDPAGPAIARVAAVGGAAAPASLSHALAAMVRMARPPPPRASRL